MQSHGTHEIELVPGSGGVFEVSVNGVARFSKRALGRFPTDPEIDSWVKS
ncbi:MAG: hypothetical protein HYX63_23220 [Gammaproteobacteria bacterium]|nr:hypothetical protein [Gammaproteobacteria bacterium]